MTDKPAGEAMEKTPICPYCDHPLHCGHCGMEHPTMPTPPQAGNSRDEALEALEPFRPIFEALIENPPLLGEYLFIEKRKITFDGEGDFTMADVRQAIRALASRGRG